MTPQAVGENRQELRLALSLRGGVSLAVWMGGAIAEIDRLTRADPAPLTDREAPVDDPYALLLHLSGYRRVNVDVITGASAGGLNGVIYAASKVYGFDFDDMLDVWVELGDIEALTRSPVGRDGPPGSRRVRRPPSLLKGDEYFHRQLADNLAERIRNGDPARTSASPLELILSATLADPVAVSRNDDPYSRITEERRMASFRFRYTGTTASAASHFQPREAAADLDDPESTANLLALAGRATSSFPVAFEPASVGWSARHVFSDAPVTADGDEVAVLDGGVLDNIPVGKAIEAISASPSPGPTDRCLLFLHPDPGDPAPARVHAAAHPAARPAPGAPGAPGAAAPAAVARRMARRATLRAYGALQRTFRATVRSESLLADLVELEAHNREAEFLRLRLQALFTPFAAGDGTALVSQLVVAGADQKQVALGIGVALSTDRIVRTLDGDDRGEGVLSPLRRATLDPTDRIVLADRVRDALTDIGRTDPHLLVADASNLRCAVDLLIGWARELELSSPDEHHGGALAAIGAAKHTLYRLRLAASYLAALQVRAWSVRAVDGLPIDVDAYVASTAGLAQRVGTAAPAGAAQALLAATDTALHTARAGRTMTPVDEIGFLDALEALGRDLVEAAEAGELPADGVDVLGELWSRTAAAGETLVALAATVPPPTDQRIEHRAFRAAAGQVDQLLRALATLTAPLRATSLQSDSAIRFFRIAGTNETPLAPLLPGGSIDVRTKLCGNELFNFAAFFSARWRANDWMWGRLDATATLVNLLLESRRVARFGTSASHVAETVAAIAASSGVTVDADDRHAVSAELVAAFADPDTPRPLTTTKRLVIESLQRRVLGEMIDVVAALGDAPEPLPPRVPAPVADLGAPLDARLGHYRVGHEGVGDLDPTRRTQIGMRLAMVATKAFQPDGTGVRDRAARAAVVTVRPILLFATFVALLWRRGVFLLMAIAGGFLVGPWQRRPSVRPARSGIEGVLVQTRFRWLTFAVDRRCPPPRTDPACARLGAAAWFDPPWFHRLSFALVVVLLLVGAWRYRALRGRPQRTWYGATLVLGLVYVSVDAFGLATGPLSVSLGAAAVAAISTAWMSVRQRIVTVVGSLVAYLGSAAVMAALERGGEPGRLAGWWSVLSLGLAASFIGAQCTLFDVFPAPRVPTGVVPAARARAAAVAGTKVPLIETPSMASSGVDERGSDSGLSTVAHPSEESP